MELGEGGGEGGRGRVLRDEIGENRPLVERERVDIRQGML